MADWCTLLDLKADMGINGTDTRDDGILRDVLAAACAFVARVRPEFNYSGDPDSQLPPPPDDVRLGTARLAGRWHTRRRSPDALVQLGDELGASRVPSFDPDIERLLGIGKYRRSVIA